MKRICIGAVIYLIYSLTVIPEAMIRIASINLKARLNLQLRDLAQRTVLPFLSFVVSLPNTITSSNPKGIPISAVMGQPTRLPRASQNTTLYVRSRSTSDGGFSEYENAINTQYIENE
jgi:hypothetical protein